MTKYLYAPILVALLAHAPSPVYANSVPITGINPGFSPADLNAVDALVLAWMRETGTPGISIAFSRHGALVLTRGYGYADIERQEPVTPKHRFRIASISKPITAVAIAKVIEQKNLAWNSKVFGRHGMLGTRYGSQPNKAWQLELTVDHLLTHTSGAWPNNQDDPMFSYPYWSMTQLINHTLDHAQNTAQPGTQYAYSNFGYALLGRIIEHRTGKSYQRFVREQVLGPMGIRDMVIGGNTLSERHPYEVRYYPERVSYGMNITRMAANGGWVSSPRDLLRFMANVDGRPGVPDQLHSALLNRLYTPWKTDEKYARGWSVNKRPNYWHRGSLPGTLAILVHTHDGYGWAALANSRPQNEEARGKLSRLMWNIKRTFQFWPPVNLF